MRFYRHPFGLVASLALFVLAPGCGNADDTGPGGGGGEGGGAATTSTQSTSTEEVVRPDEPEVNDAAFVVLSAPKYLLVGDKLSPPTPSFQVRVTVPAGVMAVDLWVDDAEVLPLVQEGADFVIDVAATSLALGDHRLMLAERGAQTGFYVADFVKGHALYMIISTDWDFSDVADVVLDQHEKLHAAHPELKITHLLGPYTYTDPEVPQARRDEITAWAKMMRDTLGDEIGLHVHPRCTFVEAAGLPCLTEPSVAYPAGDPSGYTVRLGAYSEEDWNVLFAKAKDIWAEVGFASPTSFRAGAWTLEAHVARALADAGFVADSSAVNWPYLEEWKGDELYTWNQTQWGPINDTSQPYYLTTESVLPGGAGTELPLLELPDNGAMVDYWTVAEMKNIFDANWTSGALEKPIQVSTGFHPAPAVYYSAKEYQRLDEFFTYVDGFLASKLSGPVVYIRMTDSIKVW